MKARATFALLFLLLVIVPLTRAQAPESEYSAIITLVSEADSLADHRAPDAIAKYRDAHGALQKFQQTYPNWQKELVGFRLQDLAAKISSSPPSSGTMVPAAKPPTGPAGLFPKMPSAPRAFAVDLRKDTRHGRATAWALQGLINQQAAEVFTFNTSYESQMLTFCSKPWQPLAELVGENSGLRNLFAKYATRVQRMFLYDPERNWTWYLALMAGAQSNGIPVTEPLHRALINEFGWKGEVVDFRDRWPSRLKAYDWALAHLMPRCSKQVVFALRMDKRLTDYVVASKGFIFWLDFKKPDEHAEIEKIFRSGSYRVGTSLMGYGSNADDANATANRFGIGYVVSDNYSNGSFWSSFPNKTYTQPAGKVVDVQPGKVYASIMWSDGDNISFDQNPLYVFWTSESRGSVPVATQVAPTLQELNSPLLDWFYEKMSPNDELVCGPTGLQFIFVRDFPESQFDEWCRLTRFWCAGAGLRSARIWIAPYPSRKFTSYMTQCGWEGVLGEGWFLRPDMPPKVDTYGAGNEAELFRQMSEMVPHPQRPRFVNFTPIVGGFDNPNGGYRAIKRVVDRVNAEHPDRYVFLLPRDQFATIRHYYYTNGLTQAACRPGSTNGLAVVGNEGDGVHRIVQQNGERCWVLLRNSRLYFDVDERFLVSPATSLELILEYLDGAPVPPEGVDLEFDSDDRRLPLGGAYKRHPLIIKRNGSMRWQTARFRFNNALFGGRQNFRADFRFGTGSDDFFIRSVSLRRVP